MVDESWKGKILRFKRVDYGGDLPYGLRLTPGYWFVSHIQDPEHMKVSEAQHAVHSLPLREPQDGYILRCDGDPKELQPGDDYQIWPISVGPKEDMA